MALDKAKSMDLDLVEVSPNTDPPVCRMMNFGKYIFELNKKAQSNKKKQRQAQVKEIKFRPNTESGDYQIKLRKLIAFLDEGDKAKVTLRFRGRELEHKDIGFALMQRIKADLVNLVRLSKSLSLKDAKWLWYLDQKNNRIDQNYKSLVIGRHYLVINKWLQ